MKTLQAWVARDEDGMLFLYLSKPINFEGRWIPTDNKFTVMNEELFPEVQWTDEEPTEIKLTVKKTLKSSK